MEISKNERTVIRWLQEYQSIKLNIEFLKEGISDIILAGFGNDTSKEFTSKTNKTSSVVENAYLQLHEGDLTGRINQLQSTVNAIDCAMFTLSDIEKLVIINSVMKGKFYYQYIHSIGVCERSAKKYKRVALGKMVKFIFGNNIDHHHSNIITKA